MITAAGVAGFFLLFALVIWLAIRSAKQQGIVEAQNDVLKAGAAKERKAGEILARPPADRDAILKWMRGEDKQP